ncbi:MAG TPA: alpha/beta hydrolase [Spirochaetes bacterium]|nr:alpha/beta hydrolase [Spirochaetota bacterium]
MQNRRINLYKWVFRIALWASLLLPGLSYTKSPTRLIEKTPVISGQKAYIALPYRSKRGLPQIIIYSHGSNTTVTRNLNDPFMKKMRSYGRYFTRHNYIFAASAQHGANRGSLKSVQDMYNLIHWIQKRYRTKSKVHLIGFSMGGLPTFHFALRYPGLVDRIAGLAPTIHLRDWNKRRYRAIRRIRIGIWHGDRDQHVSFRQSQLFVRRARRYRLHIRLVRIRGARHYDVDNELKGRILRFFIRR